MREFFSVKTETLTKDTSGAVVEKQTSEHHEERHTSRKRAPAFIWLPIENTPLFKLSKSQLTTFLCIATEMNFDNEIDLSPAIRQKLSSLLKITRTSFSNNLAELKKLGCIKNKGSSLFMVSPHFVGKGETKYHIIKQVDYDALKNS
ncbi:hypothetical protein GNIT_1568 [Glaciecola nitratireducens FR1064]|uniref:Plasmid replication protein RepL domain-containing protein n=2 Tax=Brumicola TaxID=3160924 RepID=G4QGP9_GLANF|nr:hypothetical protein GNIT_1568 [Glaciecola nitratireducens FR1064]